jgi:hypothetical protein
LPHRIPFSPPAKRALELGHEAASDLGSEPIGPEHLLPEILGLTGSSPA